MKPALTPKPTPTQTPSPLEKRWRPQKRRRNPAAKRGCRVEIIRRRSDSDTGNLRLTISVDEWRATLSCCLTRSRKIARVLPQPPSRSGHRRRGSNGANALRCASPLTAPSTASRSSAPPATASNP
jgi:hypothetical protein